MNFQKRAPRYTTSDWFTHSYSNWTNSERTRHAGSNVREESKSLRNEVNNKVRWDQLDTNNRLSDRIDRLRVIKTALEIRVNSLDGELESMNESKDRTEKVQTWFYHISQVNTENLVLREGRREVDLVVDEAEEELHREKSVLATVRAKLQNKISESFEQLALLKETRKGLLECLQRKNETLEIDIDQYNLTEESPNISFKSDPTRFPENMLTLDEWENVCCSMLSAGESTVIESVKMRETVHHVIHSIKNDVYSQNLAVLFALRKRVHEVQMALEEDKYQKKLLEEEASRLEEEIRCIDHIINEKMQSLKLAQARLENRLYRTEEDLCKDSAQYGLVDEVNQLESSLAILKEKKCQARRALDCIEKQIHKLNTDISNKMLSMRIDQQCIESRQKLEPSCALESTVRDNGLVSGSRVKTVLPAY